MDATLILAPSSGGKSTYIRAMQKRGAIAPDRSIIFAFQLESADPPTLDASSIVHINMFHPFENKAEHVDRQIGDAPFVRELERQGFPRRAIILVVPRRLLAKRILLRDYIEPDLMDEKHVYAKSEFFELVSRADMASIYRQWVDFLHAHEVEIDFISSEDSDYRHISSFEDALSIISSCDSAAYTADEKQKALSGFTFNYQCVDGFEAWTGQNQDRAATYEIIKPHISGESVLDLGCGLGYFSFRLEKDGVRNIVGTDLKKDRFLAACAIGETIGTRCKFEFYDMLQEGETRSFDTVLMLNVLHHLHDPVGGLKHAAKRTRSTLILEYPTLGDPRFRATLGVPAEFDPSLPLIGVSLFDAEDQTFVFSDEAIRRILIDNLKLFRQAVFEQSPLAPDRRIAVFVK